MKIVAISNLSPQHHFVLAQIHQQRPLSCVIQPVWSEQPGSAARYSDLLATPVKSIVRRIRSRVSTCHAKWLDRQIARSLPQFSGLPSLEVARKVISHQNINSTDTAAFIRRLEPDLVITSGCPLLLRRIFDIPRLGTINVHWGIAPEYRGENTLFWPLYHGDYGHLGATIHQIDEGIDTGPILGHCFPELSPNDTEATITAKTATALAILLHDVLAAIERADRVAGVCLGRSGRLYRERDRSLRHDSHYWLLRTLRLRTPPKTAGSQKLYCAAEAQPRAVCGA
jgi:methionyl-tRNA formyltransferase